MAHESKNPVQASGMPANATVYLIRHAEKPDSGAALSPAGQARAAAYVQYLQRLTDRAGKMIQWNYLFASQDSEKSDRPILTITPLANALKKTIDSNYSDKAYTKLVDHVRSHAKDRYAHANLLICWHHGEILQLAQGLGASPTDLPATSNWPAKWPGDVFGWLLKIRYKDDGSLHGDETEAINQHLMPDDITDPAYNV